MTRADRCLRIDSHQHAFWRGLDPSRLVADLDEQGIASAWLLTWEIAPGEMHAPDAAALNPAHLKPDGSHPGITLSDTILTRDRYPDRFVAGFCPHAGLGDAAGRFERAVRDHGIRVCGEWKCRMAVDDARCLELFREAGKLGCPVVVHLDVPELPGRDGARVKQERWYGGTVGNLEAALQACPETAFIGHGPGFWREISGDADEAEEAYPSGPVRRGGRLPGLLARYSNLYADLSAGSALNALARDREHARIFLAEHASRLLFGRDDYGGELIEFLCGMALPEGVLKPLFLENALRLAARP